MRRFVDWVARQKQTFMYGFQWVYFPSMLMGIAWGVQVKLAQWDIRIKLWILGPVVIGLTWLVGWIGERVNMREAEMTRQMDFAKQVRETHEKTMEAQR